jgi:ubiquinone/menaquinone biosynthesis C-methylase UbiE
MTTAGNQYPLGSDPAELERLDHQGRMLASATRMLFEAAGVRRGMRVLDLGCGAGNVAFVLADLVSDAGEVQGIDRSADAVGKATVRARQRQLERVRFTVGDITESAPGGPYDAIVSRLVLMYVSEPCGGSG